MAKRGRPKKENPRNVKYTVRLDSSEDRLLNEVCCRTGKNRTDIIRDSLLNVLKGR